MLSAEPNALLVTVWSSVECHIDVPPLREHSLIKWMGSPELQPDVSRNSATQATGGDALTSEILKRTSKRYQGIPFLGHGLKFLSLI